MNDTAALIAVCIATMAAVVVLAVGILKLIDRATDAYFAYYDTPERRSAERIAREARLLRPDWRFYEQHLQRPVPEAVRALYADHRLLLSAGFEYDDMHDISEFGTIDAAEVLVTLAGIGVVPLAFSDIDIIHLLPGSTESDVVYVTYHDGGDTGELAPDPATFLEQLRQALSRKRNGLELAAEAES